MNNTALLQPILDEAFETLDFRSLASHLAEDVVFEVTPPEGLPTTAERRGKQEVLDYFTSLGDIVTFWRVQCFGDGDRVVAVGSESFTIPRYGITLGGEFALLLHICNGLITRFLLIEDLSESSALEEAALEDALMPRSLSVLARRVTDDGVQVVGGAAAALSPQVLDIRREKAPQ